MNAKEKYQCGECAGVHASWYEADDCCDPDVYTVFVCSECEEPHEIEKDANACCNEEGRPPTMSHADLEARGQQRLGLEA